jgi:O-antigen ligase/tetratricopeptide (TPR) repeat protein
MRDLEESTTLPERQGPTARSLWNGIIPVLPVLACFLGGATQKWGEGVVVAILGFYLLVQPPRTSLGTPINSILIALALCGTIAFLPARWFLQPLWRTALVNDFGISLPSTLSPQPWITSTCLISFIAGLAWLYVVCSQDLELRAVRSQLRVFAAGIIILAAVSVLFYLAHTSPSFWINEPGFGPFPNRNQTGDLLGLTAIVILACGQDDIRHGRKRWILWLAGFGIVVAAVIFNFSRAGLLILVLGSVCWTLLFALHRGSTVRIAVGLSALLLLATTILLAGGQTLERFHLRGFQGTGVSSDFRWLIFHDTFDLIRASPWCGIGLGNFESIFAVFRNASFNESRAIHPESDWLWLWTELGWPAVVLVLAGAAFLIRKVFPLRVGTNQRFRLAALIAAIFFALHGLVDVSAHRVGTALSGMFLLGLALHRPLQLRPSRVNPIVFRVVGTVLLISGFTWLGATRAKSLLPGSLGVTNAKQLASIASPGHNFRETIAVTGRALQWAPIDWQLYFYRALAEVAINQPEPALDDFRRARFLEPNGYQVPLAEGKAWLGSQPVLAVSAWRDALRKAGSKRAGLYSEMWDNVAKQNSPEVSKLLEEMGLRQHDLLLGYLGRISGATFGRGIHDYLKNDPDLKTLTDTEKLALFALWSERGDLDELSRMVEEHADWIPYAWLGLAKHAAAKNDFRTAYELTQQFGEAVALPRSSANGSLEELQNRFYTNPDNATGYALFREQMQRGRADDALLTVRRINERANAPAYFHFLEAQGWAAKENWERAWQAWLAYRNSAAKK